MTRHSDTQSHSIDQYLVKLAKCMTCDCLLKLYRQEMAREGYCEASYAKLCGSVEGDRGPFGSVSCDNLKASKNVKILDRRSEDQRPEIPWLDAIENEGHCQDPNFENCTTTHRTVCGRISMPFRRPDGEFDVFSLCVTKYGGDAARRFPAVNIKTYATLQRYRALEDLENCPRDDTAPSEGACCSNCDTRSFHRDTSLESPLACPHRTIARRGEMNDVGFCHAISLADIAWRRYCSGLLELNERIEAILGKNVLQELIARGLIEEVADDRRFRYVIRPSRSGLKQLRNCPNAAPIRNEMRRLHVEARERPDD